MISTVIAPTRTGLASIVPVVALVSWREQVVEELVGRSRCGGAAGPGAPVARGCRQPLPRLRQLSSAAVQRAAGRRGPGP